MEISPIYALIKSSSLSIMNLERAYRKPYTDQKNRLNKQYLLGTTGTRWNMLYTSTTILRQDTYYCSYFADEENKIQKG